MRKWLQGTICALTIATCAGFSGCEKEVKEYGITYKEESNGFYLTKETKEGYDIIRVLITKYWFKTVMC